MNVIIDRSAARWLPSRYRFALARLLAFVQLQRSGRASKERKPEHLILSLDRDQSAAENHAVAIWVFLTMSSYLAAFLPLPAPLAFLAAIPLASLAIHVPIVGGGLVLRFLLGDRNHANIVSVSSMGLLLIWSAYVAQTATWARFVAWFFFGVLASNGIAALILRLLRSRVRILAEARCAH